MCVDCDYTLTHYLWSASDLFLDSLLYFVGLFCFLRLYKHSWTYTMTVIIDSMTQSDKNRFQYRSNSMILFLYHSKTVYCMDRHILTQNFTGQGHIYLYSTIQLQKNPSKIFLPLCLISFVAREPADFLARVKFPS